MLSAQWAKVLSDILNSKTRTILIVLSIMAGLTAVGTILSARTLLSSSVEKSYAAVNYANGSIVTQQSFDKNFVRSFDNNNLGAVAVDGRRSLPTRALNQAGKKTNIIIFSVVDYGDTRVNKISSKSGQWPPPRHEILIETSSLAVLGIKEGDEIQIETVDKKLRSLKVVGTVIDVASPPAALVGSAYGYIDSETMEWLGTPNGFNELIFTVQPDKHSEVDTKMILDKMVNQVKNAGYTVVSSLVVSEIPINSMIQILLLVLGVIGLLTLALSVFLIINSISAMVAQQTRLIGVMKAIGGSAAQILWMYLSVSLFYGLIALCISIPLSIMASNALSGFLVSSFNLTIQGDRVQFVSILVQVFLAFLVPTLSSLFPLINGLRISATQALGGSGINQVNSGSNIIDHLLSGPRLWFARYILMRPILLAVRNMFRQKIRLILTLVTLVLAGAVFITVFNLRATISNSMNLMTQMQSYDLQVNLSKEYRIDEIRREFGKIKGVQAVDTWLTNPSTRTRPDHSESNGILLTALNPNSSVISAPVMIEGRWLEPGDQNAIVITSMLMKNEPDLKVGQDMILKINDRNYPFHIVGEAMTGGSTVYSNYDYLANLLHNKTRASTVLITMDKSVGMTPGDFKTRLDSQLKTDGFLIASIQTTVEVRGNTETNFGSVLILLILMALILAVVGGLSLMGTMSINVIERTREIGVMRAIGSSNGGVLVVFMTEGVGIGLMSCLFSIPVSFPITSMVASAIGILATGTSWIGTFTTTGVFIWMVLVIILSLLANYLPARSAARLTVREVLAYE